MGAPLGPCSLEGSFASIEVHGRGHAALIEPDKPFEGAKVRLTGAQIEGHRDANRWIQGHTRLEPVKMSRGEDLYVVTYEANPYLTIDIAEGGRDGAFQGTLPGVDCSDRWCKIAWTARAKKVEVDGAPKGALLVGQLPLAPKGQLSKVIVRGVAAGKLRCSDGERALSGDFEWAGGDYGALTVKEVRYEQGHLTAIVHDARPPVQLDTGMSLKALWVLGGGAAVVAFAVLTWVVRRRRRGAPGSKRADDGHRLKEFQDALLAAYPEWASLEGMVRFGLDQKLNQLAPDKVRLGETVFELLKWAEAHGKLDALLAAALQGNSGNPVLVAYAEQVFAARFGDPG